MIVLVITALAAVVILIGGFHLAQTGTTRVSTTSGLQLVWAYASMPVAGLSMVVFVVELGLRALRGEDLEEFGGELVERDTPAAAAEEAS